MRLLLHARVQCRVHGMQGKQDGARPTATDTQGTMRSAAPCPCRWATVFPLAVFTLAAEHLSAPVALDSEGLRAAAAALAGATVAVWAAVAGRTAHRLLAGALANPPPLG